MKKNIIWLFVSLSLSIQAQQTYGLLRTVGKTTDHDSFMATDSKENLYVVNSGCTCVQKYDSSGVYLLRFGTPGTGNGLFNSISDIAIDKDTVYVADKANTVQKFKMDGTFIARYSFGPPVGQVSGGVIPGSVYGMTVSNGSMFLLVVNQNVSMEIYKFTTGGVFQWSWLTQIYTTLVSAAPIQADGLGNIYVSISDSIIRRYSPDGTKLSDWKASFKKVTGIAFDVYNNCYVTDMFHPALTIEFKKFDPSGVFVTSAEYPMLELGDISNVKVEVSKAGYVYITDTDYYHGLVHVFTVGGVLQPPVVAGLMSAQETGFMLYPNPSNDKVYLKINEPARVVVSDSIGRVVYENNVSDLNFVLPDFVAGTYIVTIKCETGSSTKKLIKY